MLKLGIFFKEDGSMISHRSLLKVFLNPFLRLIGWQIISITSRDRTKIDTIRWDYCGRSINFKSIFHFDDTGLTCKKERLLF